MAERQFGPYRLVRQIAVGGMAEIHLAKTKGIAGFEKYVALKMIHPNYAEDEQFIGMLVDEAKIAVQLNHGNIAQTFDLGRVGDTFYITMEYVDGADLYKILRRGSEDDFEMPLDVCAFVAKEVASALDHAHRKRDHAGKTLGIVHRDVSPQNVLISYSGEVKLVDFGIAKATMKARQTAVGVIKGKYYYMSPEQAWGDQIDYRSDIFSAGIVLYEMMTGQMLYLEEDLTNLLEMVRKADIAPPSTLRRGVPPQLEKIVMHALAKDRRDRYQSAGDFSSDLERFLHAYSPVFTASKVAAMIRTVLGPPPELPEVPEEVEHRDGPMSTHTLSSEDLIQDKEELQQDENSVIFRVADLRPKKPTESPRQKQPTGAAPVAAQRPKQPSGAAPVVAQRTKQPTGGVPAGPRVTRQADIGQPQRPKSITAIPSIPKMAPQPAAKPALTRTPTPPAGSSAAPGSRPAPRPRDMNEVTREVEPMRKGPAVTEDSGLLGLDRPRPNPSALAWKKLDGQGTLPGLEDADENLGEHTMISSAPMAFGGGFSDDTGSEDSIADATQISSVPTADDTNPEVDGFGGGTFTGETHNDPLAAAAAARRDEDTEDTQDRDGEDGPTIQRDFRDSAKPRAAANRGSSPPALAAKIHAPAVSELRKPRASRKTPHAGVAVQPNVLQAIVGSKPMEAMPTPRPGSLRTDDSGALTMPGQPSELAGQNTALEAMGQNTVLEGIQQSTVLESRGPMQQSTLLGQTSPLAPGQPYAQQSQRPGGSQPMPQQRQHASSSQPMPQQRPGPSQPPGPPQPSQYSGYATDASGLPLETPPSGSPAIPHTPYGQQPGYQGYPPGQGYPGYPQQGYPGYPPQSQQSGQVSPGALYQLQPYGAPPPQPMSLTGQLRLFEADELGDKYKLNHGPPRWLKVGLASVIAIAAAAALTFFIIKATRDTAPSVGRVRIESVPPGAEVTFDGTRMAGATPLTIDSVPTGTRHDVQIELGRHKPYTETVDIPKNGGEVSVRGVLEPMTGKIRVVTQPDGADIKIDGVLRGRAPMTIPDIEMSSAKKLELRLTGYEPVILDLTWPANGEININQKLVR